MPIIPLPTFVATDIQKNVRERDIRTLSKLLDYIDIKLAKPEMKSDAEEVMFDCFICFLEELDNLYNRICGTVTFYKFKLLLIHGFFLKVPYCTEEMIKVKLGQISKYLKSFTGTDAIKILNGLFIYLYENLYCISESLAKYVDINNLSTDLIEVVNSENSVFFPVGTYRYATQEFRSYILPQFKNDNVPSYSLDRIVDAFLAKAEVKARVEKYEHYHEALRKIYSWIGKIDISPKDFDDLNIPEDSINSGYAYKVLYFYVLVMKNLKEENISPFLQSDKCTLMNMFDSDKSFCNILLLLSSFFEHGFDASFSFELYKTICAAFIKTESDVFTNEKSNIIKTVREGIIEIREEIKSKSYVRMYDPNFILEKMAESYSKSTFDSFMGDQKLQFLYEKMFYLYCNHLGKTSIPLITASNYKLYNPNNFVQIQNAMSKQYPSLANSKWNKFFIRELAYIHCTKLFVSSDSVYTSENICDFYNTYTTFICKINHEYLFASTYGKFNPDNSLLAYLHIIDSALMRIINKTHYTSKTVKKLSAPIKY
jgi:hypothetical protein